MTKDIQVNPKPVVLIPGLFSIPESVGAFMDFFKNTPNTAWALALAQIYPTKAAADNISIIEKSVKDIAD